jgi:hypothetical protein
VPLRIDFEWLPDMQREKIALGGMWERAARAVGLLRGLSVRTLMSESDLEHNFVCQACGNRGADIRPDFEGQGLQT